MEKINSIDYIRKSLITHIEVVDENTKSIRDLTQPEYNEVEYVKEHAEPIWWKRILYRAPKEDIIDTHKIYNPLAYEKVKTKPYVSVSFSDVQINKYSVQVFNTLDEALLFAKIIINSPDEFIRVEHTDIYKIF